MERSIILRDLMEQKGMKVADVVRESGLAYSTVKTIFEKGIEKASYINICKICNALGITPDELEKIAKGGIVPEQVTKEELEFIHKYRSLDDHGRETIDFFLNHESGRMNDIKILNDKIVQLQTQSSHRRLYAYYGKIASAGTSVPWDDVLKGTREFEECDYDADYTIGVSGDSMEPTFYDGDIVYVKKANHVNRGDIGIFKKDGYIYIKEAGDDCLLSHNPSYPPMSGDDIQCLGKVFGKVR